MKCFKVYFGLFHVVLHVGDFHAAPLTVRAVRRHSPWRCASARSVAQRKVSRVLLMLYFIPNIVGAKVSCFNKLMTTNYV